MWPTLPPRNLLSYMYDDSLSSPAVESHTCDMQATPLDLLDSANLPVDDMMKPNFYETHDPSLSHDWDTSACTLGSSHLVRTFS